MGRWILFMLYYSYTHPLIAYFNKWFHNWQCISKSAKVHIFFSIKRAKWGFKSFKPCQLIGCNRKLCITSQEPIEWAVSKPCSYVSQVPEEQCKGEAIMLFKIKWLHQQYPWTSYNGSSFSKKEPQFPQSLKKRQTFQVPQKYECVTIKK